MVSAPEIHANPSLQLQIDGLPAVQELGIRFALDAGRLVHVDMAIEGGAIMTSPVVLEVFGSHAFLNGLSEWVRMRLAYGVMPFTAAPGEYLGREGQTADSFFLIQEGHVDIGTCENGQQVRLQTMGPGDVVGWSWILPPHRWQFDCRAVDAVKGIRFDAGWLRNQCETDRELGYALVKHLLGVIASRLAATRLLTKPLTDQPHSPKPKAVKPPKTRGSSVGSEALQGVPT